MTHHLYELETLWVGNLGTGTSDYKAYSRAHVIRAEGKSEIQGSSDKAFHGDVARWNPEELLIAALSQCHMLSFLHVAQAAGVIVESYADRASGVLDTLQDGSGRISEVTLRPQIEISGGDESLVPELHHRAGQLCFIANSVNFPVLHEPTTRVVSSD
ncbi:MAG: OsmC family protein [Pontimonas sp.]|nr:OsmC family protein [Pontimonas sp.]